MIQLQVLSGNQAGAVIVARRFPFCIGRASAMDLCLNDPGVWDHHLVLALMPESGFILSRQSDALAYINGTGFDQIALRNGDVIELGSARLQFWLAQTRQRSFRQREILTWCFLGLLCLTQVALVYWQK
jgi:pSer/pThr/pTyr-binding forkhead associated (FHA) protein